MNFVINIPGDRVIGVVDELKAHMFPRYFDDPNERTESLTKDVPLHHLELRHDADTDKWFAAIVYELTPGSVR